MKLRLAKMFGIYLAAAFSSLSSISHAVELDPKVLVYQLPDQIKWGPVTPNGNLQAILFGDPNKPGLYGVLNRWMKGNHFSRA